MQIRKLPVYPEILFPSLLRLEIANIISENFAGGGFSYGPSGNRPIPGNPMAHIRKAKMRGRLSAFASHTIIKGFFCSLKRE